MLTDAELVSVLLSAGRAGRNAVAVAERLLKAGWVVCPAWRAAILKR